MAHGIGGDDMSFDPVTFGAAKGYTDKAIESVNPDAFLGTTTTPLSDGATTNPITINNKSVTAKSGQIAQYDVEEFIFDGTTWSKFGGSLAGLTDVTFNDLQEGDYVKYDGTKWINYQEPYTPPEWGTGTDAEIVEALEKHYAGKIDLHDYWSVGDERTVSLSAMQATGVGESHAAQDIVLVLSNEGGKDLATPINGITQCAFQVDQKNSLNEKGYMNSTSTNSGGWKNSQRRTWCNSIYKNALPSTIRGIFKEFINQSGAADGTTTWSGVENTTDTFALRAQIEIYNSTSYSVEGEGTLIKYYETSANRSKKVNGSAMNWWGRSPVKNNNQSFFNSYNSSGGTDSGAENNYGISPFGCI